MRHKKLYIVISIIVALLIVAIITHKLWLEAIARFLIVEDELSKADVIVVLGGGGKERINHAAGLYKSGYSKRIIMTGKEQRIPGFTGTWADFAKQEALLLGIPEEAIILEEMATDTDENAEYAMEIIADRAFESAIVVSSPYHMRRSRMIFRKIFEDQAVTLKFSSVPVEDSNFQVKGWWKRRNDLRRVVWEYRKLVVRFFRSIF